MQDALIIVLTGLALGSIYGAIALGLVVTYKGTGVINFAAGALGAWSAFVYSDLHSNGILQLPVAGIPASIHLSDSGLPMLPSLLIATLYGFVLGLVVFFVVFRPLRDAPTLGKVVASVGVMLAVQALISERFGTSSRVADPLVPHDLLRIGNIAVSAQMFWLVGILAVLTMGVAAWFRWARSGLAMRAAAQSPLAASLAGYSPSKLGALAWAVSTALIAFMAVLTAPVLGLNADSYALYVIPGLACALVGRLKAVVPAALAGVVLGMVSAEATYLSTKSWWPSWANSGVTAAIPFLAIIVILTIGGKSLSARGGEEAARLPRVPRIEPRPVVVAVLFAIGVGGLLVTSGTIRFGLITSIAFAIVALSIVLITGLLGQVSLAQAAFAGIGGFAVAKLSTAAGIGFPWAPILAAVIAALCGVLVGLPALRIRGAHLAVVTLALAYAAEQFLFSNSTLNGIGGNPVPAPRLAGLDLSIRGGDDIARLPFGLMCLVVLTLCALAVSNLMRSGTGRRFLAVRSNERASASVGISVMSAKLIGFAMSAFLAGLGGSLLAYGQGSVSVASFTAVVGVSWLAYVYVGGISSVGGGLCAAVTVTLGILYVILDRFIGISSSGYLLVASLVLIATVIFNPEGIAGRTRMLVDRLATRRPSSVAIGSELVSEADSEARSENDGIEWRIRDDFRGAVASPAESSALPTATFEVVGLRVRYGGILAVDDVDLEVRAGQLVGLIGANGAGKTSIIDAASGFTPSTGRISLAGRAIDGLKAHQRFSSGLTRTWQSSELFADLTVLENVQVACESTNLVSSVADCFWPKRSNGRAAAMERLDMFGLAGVALRLPGELSLGQQKLVSLARALGSTPRILMADEPAAGLSTRESEAFGRALKQVVAVRGVGVLLVEHDVELVMGLCDYIYALDFGRIIAQGTPLEVRANPNVVAAYLGVGSQGAAPGAHDRVSEVVR